MANVGFGLLRAKQVAAAIMAAAAVTLVSGCSTPRPAESSDVSTPASSTPTTTPPSSVDNAKQDATAAYLGMWRNYAKAATTSDWESSLLGEFATGDALAAMSRGLYSDHSKGLVAKGEPRNNPSVSSVDPPTDPTKVMIADCGDSSNWLRYRADNGQLADDEPGGRRSITATVGKQPDGKWKVTGFAVRGVGTC